MSSIGIKLGIPGCVAKISPGAFVRVGWEGGNPSKPYAATWDGGETLTSFEITGTDIKISGNTVTLANGVLQVARQTDPVSGTAGPYPLVSGMIVSGNPNVKA